MKTRAYNFNPGPCGLPDDVMAQAQEEFMVYQNEGASVMEISHRGKTFMDVASRAENLLRTLLQIPDDYAVLFLPGGATGIAAAAPMNLSAPQQTIAYAITGHWSQRAANEGKKLRPTHIAADTADSNYSQLPADMDVPSDAAFLHYADNETIHGVEFQTPPSSSVPLVADMSSNILSRPINVCDYGMIYAGAQKNMGAPGITVVIVRKDLLRNSGDMPLVWDFALQIKQESMANTPPTFNIYLLGLVLAWVKDNGGVSEMDKLRKQKSACIYDEIARGDFYRTPADATCRSAMNVPFFLPSDSLTDVFLAGAQEQNMIGLKGHAVLGGCRASLYNPMPLAGAELLASYMHDFANKHG